MNNSIQFDTNYENINVEEVFTNDVDVIREEELHITPFDVIKKLAIQMGQEIQDPNPSCKYCYGRGYTGRDMVSKAPIPCKCIQPNFNDDKNTRVFNQTRKLSRKERRQRDKQLRRGTH